MRKSYEKGAQPDKAGLRELLATDGREHLLPLVNVFALAGGALDQIIDVIGRAAIEAVLEISAAEVAGQRQPGKRRSAGDAAYHGRQGGRVYLADRAVRVEKVPPVISSASKSTRTLMPLGPDSRCLMLFSHHFCTVELDMV